MRTQSILLLSMVVLLAMSTLVGAYGGGTGEPNDPYLIATAEDMNEIGADSNDWDKHFLLVADINLADYTGTQFNIIGTGYYSSFTGVFDGSGHTIFNFKYTTTNTDRIGLFGYVNDPNAYIQDLTLIEPVIYVAGSSYDVGSLVGCLGNGTISGCSVDSGSVSAGGDGIGGLVGINLDGTISNCHATSEVSGINYIGGLVGVNGGTISNCHATGNVSGIYHTGGLVGGNCGTISNCYATGSVSGNYSAGGLVGRNYDGTISNCYATGRILGDYQTGGLVGRNEDGTISNSYAEGSVNGTDEDVGGLVGWDYFGTVSNCYAKNVVDGNDYTGGLVGINLDGTISNCYATGTVDGNDYTGGLVGYGDANDVNTSFWDIETGGPDNAIGTPLPTVEMQTDSIFTDAGWDFIDVWNIGENQTYPFLRVYSAGDINHDDIVNFYDLAILAGQWLEGN